MFLVDIVLKLHIFTCRYFIVKSCNRENLELSVQQGVWATQRSNEAKLNEAFDSVENVILIFSVNRTRHFQVGLGSFPFVQIGVYITVALSKQLCSLLAFKGNHLHNAKFTLSFITVI